MKAMFSAVARKFFGAVSRRDLQAKKRLLAVLLLTPLLLPAMAAASSRLVVFPFRVIAAASPDSTAMKADKLLAAALGAKAQLLPRKDVQGLMTGDWPPAAVRAREMLKGLATTEPDFAAMGSITLLGGAYSVDVAVFDLLSAAAPAHFYATAANDKELAVAIDRVAGQSLAHASRAVRIAAIVPRGNKRIDSGAILRQIKTQTGDYFDGDKLKEDLKSVFLMGSFEDLRLETEDSAEGKRVYFVVKEKPVLTRILITGNNKIEEKDIRESIPLKTNTIINPRQLKEAADSVKNLYSEKGYSSAKVETEQKKGDKDSVEVVFRIDEGKKTLISEIRFVGNRFFSEKELKKLLETSEKGWFSWLTDAGRLSRSIAVQDADRIASHYHNHGFVEAKVSEPKTEQKDGEIVLTYTITENDRFRVGIVDIAGDMVEDKETLIDLLAIRRQEYLSRQTVREDVLRLTDFYAEKGFAFARIAPAVNEDSGKKRVDITFNVAKGKLVHLERINIKGNTKTRDNVIRREMEMKEGGVFDSRALRTSQKMLQRLGFFEEVNVTPQPIAGADDLMDLLVEVKEKPTGSFSVGGGYSSLDNLMLMAEISQNNFLGKGQRLALQANLSSRTNRYNLRFTEPRFMDSKLMVGLDFYDWEREYDDYTRDSQGVSVRFGYPIWEKWRWMASYSFDDTSLSNVDATASAAIRDSQDIHITSSVRLGLNRDTRNNPFDPSDGSNHQVSVEFAGGPFGGDSAFTKLEGSTSWYRPIKWDFVGHLRLAAGQVYESSSGRLPVFEKFYLGGMSTLRGFRSGDVSPRATDGSGDKIGGDKMWYMNLELLFPLVKDVGLKGVIFYDTGNVYDFSDNWDFSNIKKAVGFGFRWMSPIGPLRLEYGHNLSPTADERSSTWDFSIGGAF